MGLLGGLVFLVLMYQWATSLDKAFPAGYQILSNVVTHYLASGATQKKWHQPGKATKQPGEARRLCRGRGGRLGSHYHRDAFPESWLLPRVSMSLCLCECACVCAHVYVLVRGVFLNRRWEHRREEQKIKLQAAAEMGTVFVFLGAGWLVRRYLSL